LETPRKTTKNFLSIVGIPGEISNLIYNNYTAYMYLKNVLSNVRNFSWVRTFYYIMWI